jgi:GT2 family glycosyltransferase
MPDEPQEKRAPAVWAVVLGYNNAPDTVECLKSLEAGGHANLELLLVDNNSADQTIELCTEAVPGLHVIKNEKNLGFAGGFNVGLTHCLDQGADLIFMVNNDTVVDAQLVSRLVEAAEADPGTGILVPKIFYNDRREVIWSAGSRYRRFPPAIVLRRTKTPGDGRFDADEVLDFATTCALLLTRQMLKDTGLLDTNFFFFYDDYDLCIRAREAGYSIRYVPGAHMWHKVSVSTKAGSRSPFFWRTHGRGEAIFCRKHRKYRLMTGVVHRLYVFLRLIAEGRFYALGPFLQGYREGMRAEIAPVPRWRDSAAT